MYPKKFTFYFLLALTIVAISTIPVFGVAIPLHPVRIVNGHPYGIIVSNGNSWSCRMSFPLRTFVEHYPSITFVMPQSGTLHLSISGESDAIDCPSAYVYKNGHRITGLYGWSAGHGNLVSGVWHYDDKSYTVKVHKGDVIKIEFGSFAVSPHWLTTTISNVYLIPSASSSMSNVPPPEFGTYGLSNSAFGLPSGVIKDRYEPDNTMSQAELVRSNVENVEWGTGMHTIYPSGDVDWYKFQITRPPCTVTINTFNSNPKRWKPVDTVIYLYDSNGHELTSNDDYGNSVYSRIRYTFEHPGWYYVKVKAFGHFETGYYGIHFYFNPPQSSSIAYRVSHTSSEKSVGGAPSNSGWHLPSMPTPQDMGNWITDHVLTPLGRGVEDTINAIGSGIVNNVINPIFGVFKQVFSGIAQSVSYIAQGVENVLKSIFGLSDVAYAVSHESLKASLPNLQGVQNWIVQHVTNPLGTAIESIINSVSNGIVNYVIKPILNLVGSAFSGIKQAVEEIAEGVNNVLKSIFGLVVCAPLIEASMKSAALHIPPIGYMVVGFMIAAFGTGIIAGGIELPPPFDIVADGIGFSLVALGAIICLYGLAPQMATELFVIGSVVILIIALLKIINYLRKVK